MSRLMTPHEVWEGLERSITHILRVASEGHRANSQADLKMAGERGKILVWLLLWSGSGAQVRIHTCGLGLHVWTSCKYQRELLSASANVEWEWKVGMHAFSRQTSKMESDSLLQVIPDVWLLVKNVIFHLIKIYLSWVCLSKRTLWGL